ncbi:MAG: prenyltransferase/squalene oxidase repeat-containing protein, partial [Planctomycetota bacterium]
MRSVLAVSAFALTLALPPSTAIASPAASGEVEPGGAVRLQEVTDETRQAIADGLEYLRRTQIRKGPGVAAENVGGWSANIGFKINETYRVTTSSGAHPGVTAMAGTAFLAGGHLPGRGKYGQAVTDAVRYVLRHVQENGFIQHNETRMYSHAFATLFLAEVYGSSLDPELNKEVKSKLLRAVQFIVKAQNEQGGWRYEANAVDSDMSITVCQVMALRAARNKGIPVPQKAIDGAVRYVLKSAITDGSSRRGFGWGRHSDFRRGAFKYQYREKNPIGTRASLALTSAAMTTIFGAGLYDDKAILNWARANGLKEFGPGGKRPPTIAEMAQYIMDEYDSHARSYPNHYFYFYGHYYASQAMYIAGGPWWKAYYPRVREHLLRRQDEDGSWEVVGVGRTFGT